MAIRDIEVLVPTSPAEAIDAFGDGDGITVVAGGTIVMPELVARRLRPARALLVTRAGLAGVRRDGGQVTIGAATPVAALEGLDEPLASVARHVGDPEVRAQATVGGNLCAEASADAPRGDLQAALVALGAVVRSAGAGGERSEPVEEFLARSAGRLVLDVTYEAVPRRAGYAAARRPHAHHYTILAVCAARRNGDLRVAATGLGARATRLDPESPLEGIEPRDDALASAWYRRRVLPVLVERALAQLEEGA